MSQGNLQISNERKVIPMANEMKPILLSALPPSLRKAAGPPSVDIRGESGQLQFSTATLKAVKELTGGTVAGGVVLFDGARRFSIAIPKREQLLELDKKGQHTVIWFPGGREGEDKDSMLTSFARILRMANYPYQKLGTQRVPVEVAKGTKNFLATVSFDLPDPATTAPAPPPKPRQKKAKKAEAPAVTTPAPPAVTSNTPVPPAGDDALEL